MVDEDRKRGRASSRPLLTTDQLPPAPKRVTVVAVGPDSNPRPIGNSSFEPDAVHFFQVGNGLVLVGTIQDLRDFVIDLGMSVANKEREMLEDDVEEGRRRFLHNARQLA